MAIYSDLNSFNPTDISLLVDVESIYQSLFNIFNTRKGERLFEPEFGLDFEEELFELMDDVGAFALLDKVNREVSRWEKRVILDFGSSTITPYPDEKKYDILLYFTIVGLDAGQVYTYHGSVTQ